MNKNLEKYFFNTLPKDLTSYAPSAKVTVFLKGKKVLNTGWGHNYKYYDIASLTKIVFGNAVAMDLVHQKKISVKDSISQYLPWFKHPKIKIENLLSHTSGMQWWKPYYKSLDLQIPKELRWLQLQEQILQEKPVKAKTAIYSDLDYFFLSFIYQSVLNMPLQEIAKQLLLGNFHFNEDNILTYSKAQYAPTEKCKWRKKILQGEVHDENCWALGGVSTHAGLFGTIEAISSYGLSLREQLYDHPTRLNGFFKKATNKGDWTLGFMQPSLGGSAGKYFSPQSIGHTGFTGTSLWFDPKRDLLVCILSNRVHPTRENAKFVGLRSVLHDTIVKGIFDV
jgi:CubicO group peptidase (beta-lactamase class C family)